MATANDDFSNNASTTGVLQVGGSSVKGKIENGGDHDWLKVTLITGQTYSFYLDGTNIAADDLASRSGMPLMVLRDLSGKEVASNVWAHSNFVYTGYFNFTAPSAGEYYLDVSASTDTVTGSYAVKALRGPTDDFANTAATKGYVAVNGRTQGVLENGLDADWFKTTLIKGHSYMIQLLGADNDGGTLGPDASLYLQVFSPAMADLGTASSIGKNGPNLYVNATISGDYFIDIENVDRLHNAAGSYTVKVTEVPVDDYDGRTYGDDVAKLNIGTTLYGRTGHIGDNDAFRVDVQAGQTYVFSMRHEKLAFLDIFGVGPYGVELVRARTADDTAQYIYTADKSATLYLQVYEYDGSLGQYSISAQAVNKETTPPKLVSISTTTDGGYWVPGSDIVMTFNEAISTDTAWLNMADKNNLATWYTQTGYDVAVNGNTLTWHLPAKLESSSTYVLDLTAGFVKDLSGNAIAASGSFTLTTRANDKQFIGWSDSDRFSAFNSGNDTFDGRDGVDTVFYDRQRADFTITRTASGYTIKDNTGALGVDTLLNTERLVFSDTSYALDVDGVAGQAYRLYRAAFDRVPDKEGLGFWISHLDKDTTLNQAANFFLTSAEFLTKYGNPSDRQFVDKLYANVLHRAPDADGLKFWMDHLATDTSRAQALAYFSESPENHANVATIIGSGFEYVAPLI